MRRVAIGLVIGALLCPSVWAGGPPTDKDAKPVKELLDAHGRVWPTGAPKAKKDHETHPDLTSPMNVKGKKKWTK